MTGKLHPNLSGILVVILLSFISISCADKDYISRIPELANTSSLSVSLRTQLDEALKEAKNTPSSENIGKLGMVYHSNAFYTQADQCYRLASAQRRSGWVWDYYLGYMNTEMGASGEVASSFLKVLKDDSDNDHARYYLGIAYRNLGKNKEAEELLAGIASVNSKSGRDHYPLGNYASFQLARIYSETGRLELAETSLLELIEKSRSYGPAYRLLGNVYSEMGKEGPGKQFMDRANDLLVFSPPVDTLVDKLSLLSRSDSYLLKQIDEAQRNMHAEWAKKLTANAVLYLPENKFIIAKALNTYLWLDMKGECRALTDRHLAYYGEEFSELYNMGRSLFQKGLYDQAGRYFSRAEELKPGDVANLEQLALTYWFTDDKQKAYAVLNKLEKSHPGDPDVLAGIANIYFYNLNDIEKARSYLPGLLKRYPTNPVVQKLAGGFAEKEGNYARSDQYYKASIKGNPEDISTIRFLGTSLSDREMWGQAISHYRESMVYHPNDPYLLERLGTLLIGCPDQSLRNPEEASVYLERAFIHKTSTLTNQVYAGRGLAYAYAQLGDRKKALQLINETMVIARQAGFSQSYQAELKAFHDRL